MPLREIRTDALIRRINKTLDAGVDIDLLFGLLNTAVTQAEAVVIQDEKEALSRQRASKAKK